MRSADLTPLARDVMKGPAGVGFMFMSFFAAYILAVLPWSGWWLLARPDFILIALLFWCLHEPRAIGQGAAFALGLLMDVSDSMLLGQHAFAYVITVYAAQVLRVRILGFNLPEQTLHMLGLFALASIVMLLTNLLLGAEVPGFAYFISPAVTALCWAPSVWFLHHPWVRRARSVVPS